MRWWVVAGIALVLGGCGGAGERAPRAARTAEPTPSPGVHVRFRASDGKPVRGLLREAASGRGAAVLLVNGLVGGVDQWDVLTPALRSAGFASLVFDGRGGVDETELVKEVAGAVALLHARGHSRVAIVGSSVGASTAVLAMTRPVGRSVRAAVALSPPAAPAFSQQPYHPNDVLFMSDSRERATVKPLLHGATGSRLVVSELNGHGVALLESEPQRQAVLDWLEEHLQ
jgi:pimeloyl-ACP methyl ester carboxylesterase